MEIFFSLRRPREDGLNGVNRHDEGRAYEVAFTMTTIFSYCHRLSSWGVFHFHRLFVLGAQKKGGDPILLPFGTSLKTAMGGILGADPLEDQDSLSDQPLESDRSHRVGGCASQVLETLPAQDFGQGTK